MPKFIVTHSSTWIAQVDVVVEAEDGNHAREIVENRDVEIWPENWHEALEEEDWEIDRVLVVPPEDADKLECRGYLDATKALRGEDETPRVEVTLTEDEK
jgi:hypothetical protein